MSGLYFTVAKIQQGLQALGQRLPASELAAALGPARPFLQCNPETSLLLRLLEQGEGDAEINRTALEQAAPALQRQIESRFAPGRDHHFRELTKMVIDERNRLRSALHDLVLPSAYAGKSPGGAQILLGGLFVLANGAWMEIVRDDLLRLGGLSPFLVTTVILDWETQGLRYVPPAQSWQEAEARYKRITSSDTVNPAGQQFTYGRRGRKTEIHIYPRKHCIELYCEMPDIGGISSITHSRTSFDSETSTRYFDQAVLLNVDQPDKRETTLNIQRHTRFIGSPWPLPDLDPAAMQFYYLPGMVLQVEGWPDEFQELNVTTVENFEPLLLDADNVDDTAAYVAISSKEGIERHKIYS